MVRTSAINGILVKVCPFCEIVPATAWLESFQAFALWDRFPISDGHTLIVPRIHVESIFDLPAELLLEVWSFVGRVRFELARRFDVEAFTIGLNDGPAAG